MTTLLMCILETRKHFLIMSTKLKNDVIRRENLSVKVLT